MNLMVGKNGELVMINSERFCIDWWPEGANVV